jgi:hypothetical protein
MSLDLKEQSFIGNGRVFAKPVAGGSGFREIGNCGGLTISHTEEEKSVLDFTNSAGGKANSLTRISAVTMNVSMFDRTAVNAALGSKGTAALVASGSAVSEVHEGWHAADERILLDHLTPTAITVKDVTDVTTYTLDADYTVDTDGAIAILSTGSIGDGDTLHISYSYVEYNKVEALVTAGVEYEVKFYGLNAAQEDTPVVVTAYKVKFGAAAETALISEDFVPMDITGEIIKDVTKVAAGVSKYYKIQQVEA